LLTSYLLLLLLLLLPFAEAAKRKFLSSLAPLRLNHDQSALAFLKATSDERKG
jgi:hypothetical protein